jgi:LPPG:FO 2-phospho-L-lactate transferase
MDRLVIAVSPIIGGKAVKGPAAKMYAELGIVPSAAAVAAHYHGLLQAFVLDRADEADRAELETGGLPVFATDAIMHSVPDRARLAGEILQFHQQLRNQIGENEVCERA